MWNIASDLTCWCIVSNTAPMLILKFRNVGGFASISLLTVAKVLAWNRVPLRENRHPGYYGELNKLWQVNFQDFLERLSELNTM